MARNRIILDTDPGIDDILAMLLAFAAQPEELEVLLISVTYGNVEVDRCFRNVVTLLHNIEKDILWRRENGRPEGFEGLKACKPIVALGASEPLADQRRMADYFHGRDGIGNIRRSHPHLDPNWDGLLASSESLSTLFTPSHAYAPDEILRLLHENPVDTITLVAVGPLTNFALAAAKDPETFLKAREVVVMGGAIDIPGNPGLIKAPPGRLRSMLIERNQITPVAEFNIYADTYAAARVFALTSSDPSSTMPPTPPPANGQMTGDSPPPFLAPYPIRLSRTLKLTLFPLDITTSHLLLRSTYTSLISPLLALKSPLADWTTAFMTATYAKMERLYDSTPGGDIGLQLHDPFTVWYLLTRSAGYTPPANEGEAGEIQAGGITLSAPQDIRIETAGQWTRGLCVVDRRGRRAAAEAKHDPVEGSGEETGAVAGDHGGWLDPRGGNRVRYATHSEYEESFGGLLLERVFGVEVKEEGKKHRGLGGLLGRK